jgi:hypothetical protein
MNRHSAVAILGIAMLALFGCASEETAVTLPTFATACEMVVVPENSVIGDEVSWNDGDAKRVEIRIVPATNLPESLEGRTVQPFERWPVNLFVFPEGTSRTHEDGYPTGTARYPNKDGGFPDIPLGPSRIDWHLVGITDMPARPDDLDEKGRIVCWTYLVLPQGMTGDFDFELVIYPTQLRKGPLDPDFGPPVVLKRGKFHVAPAKRS